MAGVAVLVAEAEPALLVAVTTTRSAWPCSPLSEATDEAPAMSAQEEPAASQSSHW